MFDLLFLIIIITANILQNNREHISEKKTIVFFHWLFLVFFLFMHVGVFRTIGWVLGHFNQVGMHYYKQVGIYPPWFTLFVFIFGIIVSLFALFTAFNLSKGKEKYRLLYIKYLPIFVLSSFLRLLKGMMKDPVNNNKVILILIGIALINVTIPYLLSYLLYKSKGIKKLFS